MKKVNFSLKQKELLRKVLIIISFAAFLFSSIMIVRREIDSYNSKKLNNELSKIHEEIKAIETTNTYNDMTDDIDYIETQKKELLKVKE
jgi:hypothetical protein